MRMSRRGWSMAKIFSETVKKHPNKPCFIMNDNVTTFQDLQDYSDKVGSYFKEKNINRGDCVALLMETRPEYVGTWLGLSKIGIITALINSHLRKKTLLHCLKVANVKAIIVGTELIDALEEIYYDDSEISKLPVYQFSDEVQKNDMHHRIMKGMF